MRLNTETITHATIEAIITETLLLFEEENVPVTVIEMMIYLLREEKERLLKDIQKIDEALLTASQENAMLLLDNKKYLLSLIEKINSIKF